mgnify:CR=1 FL=1
MLTMDSKEIHETTTCRTCHNLISISINDISTRTAESKTCVLICPRCGHWNPMLKKFFSVDFVTAINAAATQPH